MFPVTSFKFLFVLFNYFKNYLISFFFSSPIDLETHILESNLNFYSYGDISMYVCVLLCSSAENGESVSFLLLYENFA